MPDAADVMAVPKASIHPTEGGLRPKISLTGKK